MLYLIDLLYYNQTQEYSSFYYASRYFKHIHQLIRNTFFKLFLIKILLQLVKYFLDLLIKLRQIKMLLY